MKKRNIVNFLRLKGFHSPPSRIPKYKRFLSFMLSLAILSSVVPLGITKANASDYNIMFGYKGDLYHPRYAFSSSNTAYVQVHDVMPYRDYIRTSTDTKAYANNWVRFLPSKVMYDFPITKINTYFPDDYAVSYKITERFSTIYTTLNICDTLGCIDYGKKADPIYAVFDKTVPIHERETLFYTSAPFHEFTPNTNKKATRSTLTSFINIPSLKSEGLRLNVPDFSIISLGGSSYSVDIKYMNFSVDSNTKYFNTVHTSNKDLYRLDRSVMLPDSWNTPVVILEYNNVTTNIGEHEHLNLKHDKVYMKKFETTEQQKHNLYVVTYSKDPYSDRHLVNYPSGLVSKHTNYSTIETSLLPVNITEITDGSLIYAHSPDVLVHNSTIKDAVLVSFPTHILKLFNTNINLGDNINTSRIHEILNGSGYRNVKKSAIHDLGGQIIIYSGTIYGGIDDNAYVLGEGSRIKKKTDKLLEVSSIYGSWNDLVNGNATNGSSSDITIEMGDMTAPMITVKRSPVSTTEPTTSVTFTVSAIDAQGNDSDKPISIDGNEWKASPYTFTVNENKNTTVWATDSMGNIRELNLNVSNIDTENPTIISLKPNTVDYTSKEVRLTAEAKDDQKLDNNPYYWSFRPLNPNGTSISETASASKTFTAIENGTVTLRVKDRLGKYSQPETYTVTNIDKTAPTIGKVTITPDKNANTKDGVTVSINVVDTADLTGNTSGLPVNAVSWDGEWGTNSKKFYENGTVTVKVRDVLGNVSEPREIQITNIDTQNPYIGSITRDKNASYITAPLKITVEGFNADKTPLTGRSYSWDDGVSWGSSKSKTITENGEYTITVKSPSGNTASETIIVDNIDNYKPTVELRLVREKRLDPKTGKEKQYWVIKAEASDIGSGIDYIESDWDGATKYESYHQSDVTNAGVYGVKVYDKAGNSTYSYLTITNEMIGKSPNNGTNDKVTDVDISTGTVGDDGLTIGGLVAEFADPSNIVYGNSGIYNKTTKNFSTYSNAKYPSAGIALAVKAEPNDGSYVRGDMTLNGVKYDLHFDNWNSGVKQKIEGDILYGFIPFSSLKSDIKNSRLKVQIYEYEDDKGQTLIREGSDVTYISAQVSNPVIRYTYNKTDEQFTIIPTSTVAGVKSTKYNYDGGQPKEYTGTFQLEKGRNISITVTDNVNNTEKLNLNSNDLGLEGGIGSLPTEGLNPNSKVKSYRSSSRTTDSYLINGNQSNTDVIPSKEVFELFE